MKVVQVFCDGSMDEIEVSSDSLGNSLKATSKSHGEGEIRFLYSWLYNDATIECYGWFDGDAGFENKHELPPSGHSAFLDESSCQLLFGDLFLAMKTDTYIDLDVSEYSEFYSYVHGGFDECDDSDSEPDTPEADEDYDGKDVSDSEDIEIEDPGSSEEEFETETDTEDSELEADTSSYEI
jgi:hypothetical protein